MGQGIVSVAHGDASPETESTDSTGVDGPRQMGGGLPRPDFLRLRPESDLIGAGADGEDLGP